MTFSLRNIALCLALTLALVGCGKRGESTIDPSAMPELSEERVSQTRAAIAGRWALDHEETLGRLSSAKRGFASAYLANLSAGVVFREDGTWEQTVARPSGLTVTQGRYEIEAADDTAVLLRMIPAGEQTGPRRDVFIEGPDVLRFSIDGHSANSEGDPFRRVSQDAFDAQMREITEH